MRETEQLAPDGVTTQQLMGRWAEQGSAASTCRSLLLGGRPIATLNASPAAVTVVCATAGPSSPLIDLLSAFAGHRPSGVLVIEDPCGGRPRAFALRDGSVVSAIEGVAAAVCSPAAIQQCVCEAVIAAGGIGTRMTLVRGDVRWLGEQASSGPGLQHLLFEAMRRLDELPRLIETLGGLDRVAVPVVVPGPQPPVDPAADETDPSRWLAARRLFRRIDGRRTLEELTEGRFEPLVELSMLVEAGCVRMEAASLRPSKEPRASSTEYAFGSGSGSSRTEHVRIDRVRTIVAPGARSPTR